MTALEAGAGRSALAARLDALFAKDERVGLGLLSGTSADAVDAALVRFRDGEKPRLLAYRPAPIPDETRRAILRIESARLAEVAELHYELGRLFAAAARAIVRETGIAADFAGSHGQTVFHRSRTTSAGAATLQIGEPAVVAAETGVLTVADFRPSDVAHGGEGAPLVPFLDRALFSSDGVPRCIVNLGGIANLTALDGQPGGPAIAFDTGPANMPIDLATRAVTGGAHSHDPDGRLAAAGTPDPELLDRLLDHPFLARPAPKSTGAQEFGADFTEAFLRESAAGREASDLLATLTRFSAEALARAYEREVAPRLPAREIVLCGGGVHNATLVRAIRERFAPIPVVTTAAHGVDPDAKEAMLFALLAHETLAGRAGNVTAATGARGPAVLGKIVWP